MVWLPKHKVLSQTCPQTQNPPAAPARPAHPQHQQESTQSHPPALHREKMSEEPEINKKSDGEFAPVHPEVPAVKEHEKASITRDLTGNKGEPGKLSCEFQHTTGDAFENICPDEEPLPGSHRGRTQFQVITCNLSKQSAKCEGKGVSGGLSDFPNLENRYTEHVLCLHHVLGLSMRLPAVLPVC